MLIPINGDKWKIQVLDDDEFDRRFGEGLEGITQTKEKIVYFNEEIYDLDTVVHELTHVFFYYLCLDAASISVHQLEEIACEVMAKHGKHILKLSNKVHKQLKRDYE
jgi:hypothetical protein